MILMSAKASTHFPSAKTIEAFLLSQQLCSFSYEAVGATATTPPVAYVLDHNHINLGEGETVFHAAKAALERWAHFDLGWVKAMPMETSIQVNASVAIAARAFGLWWLNACRIVYVIDESDDISTRFGFAYGTLPAHAEAGEERFLVEWNRADNSVGYDIYAFSRPHGLPSQVANPWLRKLQRRFARDSKSAMLRAVNG